MSECVCVCVCVYVCMYVCVCVCVSFWSSTDSCVLVCCREDKHLRDKAIEMFIEIPWDYGWDKEHNGFFYFLDTGTIKAYIV